MELSSRSSKELFPNVFNITKFLLPEGENLIITAGLWQFWCESPLSPTPDEASGAHLQRHRSKPTLRGQPTQLDFMSHFAKMEASADKAQFHLYCSHTPEYSVGIPGEQGLAVPRLDF